MNLKDFVKNVLVEIDSGIKEGASQTGKRVYLMANGTTAIHFDVAVTINAEAHGKAGGEISVVSIGSIGAKADAKIASTEVSRVEFNIYADFDTNNN